MLLYLEKISESFEKIAKPENERRKKEFSKAFSAFPCLFSQSSFPVLLLNKNLKIIYANQPCKKLFLGFSLRGNYFIDVFGKALTFKDIREIRNSLLEGKNGYTWKGEAKIKSQKMVTVQAKVYIFPENSQAKRPCQFVVYFDDVTEENKQLLRSVFMSLLEASKLKDNDTGKHILRVNLYSQCLAEELHRKHRQRNKEIDADFVDNIGFLASMHDVGKIGTPDDILNKEGPLADWEWIIMQEHTKNGAFILSTYPNPMAKEIALSHHERWDGTGYPFRLEGEMIPLAARIVAIADVYDALRMQRCYKPALPHDVAVGKMMDNRGTHFDPFLTDVFSVINRKFKSIYEKNQD